MGKVLYLGKRKAYKTTSATVVGIPREVMELLKTDTIGNVTVFYDIEEKCMKIFF